MGWQRQVRLRVGVVGLGRLWDARHKPALARLQDRFQVTAIHDQVLRRAEMEASQIGASAVEGVTALVERPDVDVIHVLSPQWFGHFPIELACAARKPVYCALPLVGDAAELAKLAEKIAESGIPFMPEFARRFYPATLRLRELLVTSLGRPRLIVGHSRLFGFDRYSTPGPTTQNTPAPMMIDPGSYLLDWVCLLFQEQPTAFQAVTASVLPASPAASHVSLDPDFEGFLAEFEGGGLAQISFGRYHREAWGDATRFLPSPGFQVYAEHGAAWLELPDRIQWSDRTGVHEERLPLEPTVGEVLNDQFHRLVCGGHSIAPTLDDALSVASRLECIRRSLREGRRITTLKPD